MGIAQVKAYSVHALTASGVIFAFLAAATIYAPQPDPRWTFFWLLIAGLVDGADGPLARRWQVKRYAPGVDGRTLDDIIDYLTFTFIPLLLVWRMGWVPAPAGVWVAAAMVASVVGFARTTAKNEAAGFFGGFPSYWNFAAYYLGFFFTFFGPWPGGWVVLALIVLTVAPVRFIYPSLAPAKWRVPVVAGALAWLILLAGMLPWYPHVPRALVWLSLVYVAAYTVLSVTLDVRARLSR